VVVRTAMKTCLAVLIGDENRLMKNVQVFTGHQIRKSDGFSHFKNGPIFMVKS
jgi:hypothetical protein